MVEGSSGEQANIRRLFKKNNNKRIYFNTEGMGQVVTICQCANGGRLRSTRFKRGQKLGRSGSREVGIQGDRKQRDFTGHSFKNCPRALSGFKLLPTKPVGSF